MSGGATDSSLRVAARPTAVPDPAAAGLGADADGRDTRVRRATVSRAAQVVESPDVRARTEPTDGECARDQQSRHRFAATPTKPTHLASTLSAVGQRRKTESVLNNERSVR
jgi:hypothetical protein